MKLGETQTSAQGHTLAHPQCLVLALTLLCLASPPLAAPPTLEISSPTPGSPLTSLTPTIEAPGQTPTPTKTKRCACAMAMVDRAEWVPPTETVAAVPAPVTTIEEIGLRRLDFWRECPYELTLRRDGRATLTVVSVTYGAPDRTCNGTIVRTDFVALAALMRREGFFDLDPVYPRVETVENIGIVTSVVVRDKKQVRRFQVNRFHETGPSALRVIEKAIDMLGQKVSWSE